MNWTLLWNSLVVASASTAFAMLLGIAIALWMLCLPPAAKKGLYCLALATLALPPFLVTNAWLDLLGYTGIWHRWISWSIYSLGGTVWILGLLAWPITALLLAGAWQRVEKTQLEYDPLLTGRRLIRYVLWPLGSTAARQAFLLTFVTTLNNFAVPALLQTKVYSAEVWVDFNTSFNAARALALSWPLLCAPLLLLLLLRPQSISWPRLQATVPWLLFRKRLGSAFWLGTTIASLFAILFSCTVPLLQLFGEKSTWTQTPVAFAAGRHAVATSFLIASTVATACVAIASAGASTRLKLGPLLWGLFLMPGAVFGIVLIQLFNHGWSSWFYQSIAIVLAAFTVRYLAVGWSLVRRALWQADPELADAARLCGASGWTLLRRIQFPQVRGQLAAAWYLTYLLALWDVETLVLIVPPGAETLALRVFNLLHYGHATQVNALCLILLGLAITPMLLWGAVSFLRGKLPPPFGVPRLRGPDRLKAELQTRTAPERAEVSLPVRVWKLSRVRRSLGLWLHATRAAGAAISFATLLLLTGCSAGPEGQQSVQSALFGSVQVIGTRGAGAGQFNKPRSLALDSADNLYVVDMTGRVQKFSPEGKFLALWQMPQTDKGKPKGMARDKAGNIIVVEPHYSRVNHFDASGKLTAQWGKNGTNAGELFFPRAVAVGSKGDIFVTEYGVVERIQRFSPFGTNYLNTIGRAGTEKGELNRAEGLGLDAQDRVYVADSCNHRVQIFTPEGKFLRAHGEPGSAPGQMSYPYDVRVDAGGLQFVCEFGNSRVQIFDSADKLVDSLGGAGPRPGQMNNPWSIALDSKGNLYVADSGNHRVQKFLRKHS